MVKLAIRATLVAKPGKEAAVEAFLKSALPLAMREAGTTLWFALKITPSTFGIFDAFADAVRHQPEVLECHMVAGGFDYLLKTRSADMNDYRSFAGMVLWQLPGVRETRTYAVMEEVKNSTHLVLPH